MSQLIAEDRKQSSDEHGKDNPPENGLNVIMVVNNAKYKIHRGRQTVAAIKLVGKVPLADDLEQVIGGKLIPLADDGFVVIKGGEMFVSHPKDSGSSNH